MSVIKKIREKYAKAAGAIIAIALVGFILMDAGSSGWVKSLFSSDNVVATVGGEKVTTEEYGRRIAELAALRRVFPQDEKLSPTEKTANDKEIALRGLISDVQVEREARKLGLSVTDAEMKGLYLTHQNFLQFYQKVGVPQEQIAAAVALFEKGPTAIAQQPELENIIPVWEALKSYMRREQLAQKYSSLTATAYYTPKFMADRYGKDQATMVGIRYVKIPFTTVPDAQVPVTDAEIRQYMEKHRGMFEISEPSRSIEYVSFDVLPNNEDSTKSLGLLNKISAEFAAKDTAQLQNFVNSSGSEETYAGAWTTKKSFMSPAADTILKLGPGQVYGPYLDPAQNLYKITRVVEKRTVPDSVKASHILIAVSEQRTDTAASKLADSLLASINAGVSFDSLARQFSDDGQGPDGGSKAKGGDLGYFPYGAMVPEFNAAAFYGQVGDLKKVRTQFGYHIIRVTGQTGTQEIVKLATISKQLVPGKTANSTMFGRANAFASANNTADKFDKTVKQQGLPKRTAAGINPAAFNIQGLGPARDLITWIYGAKVGDVSPAFTTGPSDKEHYVVAKLVAIEDEGSMSLNEANRAQLENMVRQEKKGDKIVAEYKGVGSLEAAAQKAGQPAPMMIDSLRGGGSSLAAAGYEPKVMGYALNPKTGVNTVSPPIKGRDGVYLITVAYRRDMPDPMAMQQLQMQEMQNRNVFGQGLVGALQRIQPVKYRPANIR